MRVTPVSMPGPLIVEPRVFGDGRGFFLETWRAERYAAHGLPERFVQDNMSLSRRGVLRGLHLQHPRGQGKLVSVVRGEIYDVAVDVRPDSPCFGAWAGVVLSGESHRQFYVPPGFAHGFLVTSEEAVVTYKCTEYYEPASELSIRFDDPAIGIDWPALEYVLSAKDERAPRLADVPRERLPRCE